MESSVYDEGGRPPLPRLTAPRGGLCAPVPASRTPTPPVFQNRRKSPPGGLLIGGRGFVAPARSVSIPNLAPAPTKKVSAALGEGRHPLRPQLRSAAASLLAGGGGRGATPRRPAGVGRVVPPIGREVTWGHG